jgi:hypothetical protein
MSMKNSTKQCLAGVLFCFTTGNTWADNLQVKSLSEVYPISNIKALDIHSNTGRLYAVLNDDTSRIGYLYTVNIQTGELTKRFSTGFAEIESLSFHPDGTLWGWAKGDGLIKINVQTDKSDLIIPTSVQVADIRWNHDGTQLYAALGASLWTYDGQNVKQVCDLSGYTQSLEILSEDMLLIELYGQKTVLAFDAINWKTCKIMAERGVALGKVVLGKYDEACPAQIEVAPKQTISLDQGLSTMTLEVGTKSNVAFVVKLSKNDKANSRVTFSQTIAPVQNGLSIFSDYPTRGWTSSLSTSFVVNESISGLKPGIYTITSTVAIVETGELDSKELTVTVVEPGEGDELSIVSPDAEPESINLDVSTDIIFTSLVSGTDNPPTTLTLEEVDENGLPIVTLGELNDNGTAGDLVAGDFIYSGTFTITGSVEGKKFYRTTAIYNEDIVTSEVSAIEVENRFPIGIAPSNSNSLVQDSNNGEFLYSDEVIVAFVEGTSPKRIEKIVAAESATIVGKISGTRTFQLRISGDGTAKFVWAMVTAFKAYPEVDYAEPSFHVSVD